MTMKEGLEHLLRVALTSPPPPLRFRQSLQTVPHLLNAVKNMLRHQASGALLKGGLSLYYLLTTFRTQEASDPRDKVYACLGLVTLKERITVDYNLSKNNVYKAAAQKLVSSEDLRFLAAVESRNRSREKSDSSSLGLQVLPFSIQPSKGT